MSTLFLEFDIYRQLDKAIGQNSQTQLVTAGRNLSYFVIKLLLNVILKCTFFTDTA